MSDVKPVVNTAEGANATVPLPAPPSGPGPGAPAWADEYEVPDQRVRPYREGAEADVPPASQGTHDAPGGHGTGPTVRDGGKKR